MRWPGLVQNAQLLERSWRWMKYWDGLVLGGGGGRDTAAGACAGAAYVFHCRFAEVNAAGGGAGTGAGGGVEL